MEILRRTPLYEEHLKLNARMVPFAGWEMPVQYIGLRQEHEATRNNVGLFDVSHMGEIRVKGPKALDFLQFATTNDVSKLPAGKAQYSLLPNDRGGIVDDVIVYCIKPNVDYLVCVNASNQEKDFSHLQKLNATIGADLTDESENWGQIAVQGPKAMALIAKVFGNSALEVKPFHFETFRFQESEILLARTGYTGEDGVECFVPQNSTSALWRHLLEAGAEFGVQPCGLGARDTLRTEVKFPLYGQEIDDQTNPYAAGLGWVVKPDAKDFFGKQLILDSKAKSLESRLIGYTLVDKGIARHGYKLFDASGQEIGITTSGTHSPTLNQSIGIGYIRASHGEIGTEFYVDIRSRKVLAKVVTTPFVKTKGA